MWIKRGECASNGLSGLPHSRRGLAIMLAEGRESAEGDGSWGRRVTDGGDPSGSFCCSVFWQSLPKARWRRMNPTNHPLQREKILSRHNLRRNHLRRNNLLPLKKERR